MDRLLDQLPITVTSAKTREELSRRAQGAYMRDTLRIDHAGASVGVPGVAPATQGALQAADAAMYRIKQARREWAASRLEPLSIPLI